MLTDREIFISLVDNDLIQKSDAIILLEGDGLNRYQHAVHLFKDGFANFIVFSGGITDYDYGSFPYEDIKPLILEENIPEECLYYESISLNTKQQAEEIIKLCISNNWEKIILVGSHYHQYRAYLTFLKSALSANIKLIIYNSPEKKLKWFSSNKWGQRITCLKQEFERIEEYSKFGHLSTYKEAIEYQQWKEQQ
ncbi:MAG: YdcF family protein [Bacteroidetes bacterium]|jgi:uncharacterized SAM-binding protein YcdF (DUF218 family)|nr:YdcF family protein [Bacteroidota bacterium]